MLAYLRDCARVDDVMEDEIVDVNPIKEIFKPPNPAEVETIFGVKVPSSALNDQQILEFSVHNIRRKIHQMEVAATLGGLEEMGAGDLSAALSLLSASGCEKLRHLVRQQLKPINLYVNADELFSVACSKSARSRFVHSYIDWRWQYLVGLLRFELAKVQGTEGRLLLTETQFEIEFKLLVLDLIQMAAIRHQKGLSSLGCECYLKVWKNLADLSEKLQELHYFDAFESYLKLGLDALENLAPTLRALWGRFPALEAYFLRLKPAAIEVNDPNLFILWTLCGLAESKITCLEAFQDSLANYVKTEPSEDKLRQLLVLIYRPLAEFWEPNCDVISVIWTCLYKRINSAFFMQNSSLEALVIVE